MVVSSEEDLNSFVGFPESSESRQRETSFFILPEEENKANPVSLAIICLGSGLRVFHGKLC